MAMEAAIHPDPASKADAAPLSTGTALAPITAKPHRTPSAWRKALTATVAFVVAAVIALAVALATIAAAIVGGLLALAALAARLFPRRSEDANQGRAPEGWTLEPSSPR